MSLREWLNASRGYREKVNGGEEAHEPMGRARLEELMAEYPDAPANEPSAPLATAG
jgi:hypothetical protein